MEEKELEIVKSRIATVEKVKHGDVVIKIKNGVIYRILTTADELLSEIKEP